MEGGIDCTEELQYCQEVVIIWREELEDRLEGSKHLHCTSSILWWVVWRGSIMVFVEAHAAGILNGAPSQGLDNASVEGANVEALGLPPLPPTKSHRKEKVPRCIVESDLLSHLCASYYKHFAVYSRGRKQVTQLIPSLVWKAVYAEYLEGNPESTFVEDTLKDRLRDTLKELKTGTSNEECSEMAMLQSDEVMNNLKATDGHAYR